VSYPPLVKYRTEAEYRLHFEQVYCRGSVKTFDGILVRFHKSVFDHCFLNHHVGIKTKIRFQ